METKTGQEKEIVQHIFDGFAYILLNNMQALYESERAYLNLVFQNAKTHDPVSREPKDFDPNYL